MPLDDLPTVVEADDNRDPKKAQAVKFNVAVAGRAEADKRDYFRVALAAGQKLGVEVVARRIGSPLDPVVRVHDKDGADIPGAWSDDAPGLQGDCRLAFTAPAAGDYLVSVHDTKFQGGADYTYRLRLGDFPQAVAAVPCAVKRGAKAKLTFAGPDVEGVEAVEVAAPADDAAAVSAAPKRAKGFAGWPVDVLASDHEELVETEPNDDRTRATRLPVPGGATGVFATKGDVDFYAFPAKKGTKYVATADGYEIGSPADVDLLVTDGKGAELGRSDPQPTTARVEFTAAADGDVFVRCEHLNFQHGPSEVYHLVVRPAGPDFDATLGADRVAVVPGGTTLLPVSAVNRRDWPGPVEFRVVGGGFSGTLTLADKATFPAYLSVTADDTAKPGAYAVRVRASAKIGDREVVRAASVAEPIKAAFGGLTFPPRDSLTSVGVGVLADPPFWLGADAKTEVAGGQPAKVTVTAKRGGGFADEIALTAVGLPAGVTAAVKPIAKGGDKVEIALAVPAATPAGAYVVGFKGTAKVGGKDWALVGGVTTLVVKEAAKK